MISNKRKIFLAIYIVVLLAWLAFIFGNSLADGARSSEQSGRVVAILQKIISTLGSDKTVNPAIVRTAAHFTEFFVLGLLYCIGSTFFNTRRITLILHSLSLSLFTAFTDETLQLFVSGRGADVRDIWTDFSGAFLAHLIFYVIYFIHKRIKTVS